MAKKKKSKPSRLDGLFGSDMDETKNEAEKGVEVEDEEIDSELEDSIDDDVELDDDEELLDEDQDSDPDEDDEEIEEEDDENASDQDDDEDEESDSKEWEAEKASLEKRQKDTQAEYTRKNQENIELKKRVEELEEKAKSHEQELEDEWLNSDDVDDVTKQKFLKQQEEIDTLKQESRDRESAAARSAFDKASIPLKEKYSDFDDMVKILEEEYDTSEKLQEKFKAGGRTPEIAYKLGLNIFRTRMMVDDPIGYQKYLRKLQKTKNKEKSDKKKTNIDELNTSVSKDPSKKGRVKSAKRSRLEKAGF